MGLAYGCGQFPPGLVDRGVTIQATEVGLTTPTTDGNVDFLLLGDVIATLIPSLRSGAAGAAPAALMAARRLAWTARVSYENSIVTFRMWYVYVHCIWTRA